MFEIGKPVFANFEPLNPRRTMGRNERCWCRSGRKWKQCHAVREYASSLPPSAFKPTFYQLAAQTELCYHPTAPIGCSKGIIRAHTIQKRTGLNLIAERGHVLSARDGQDDNKAFNLQLVGVNKASTFRGFCSKHDTDIFKMAENRSNVDKISAFLLSYRALCYESYMKKVAVKTIRNFRDNMDRGKLFEAQVKIQQELSYFAHTTHLGEFEHDRLKLIWDAELPNCGGPNFKWFAITFDGSIPLVASGSFFPEHDFGGNRLQPLSSPIGHLALMSFNILPFEGNTAAVFGWLDSKPQNSRFIESLRGIPSSHLASSVVQFAFDTSDNLFVSPKWWKSLAPAPQQFLLEVLRSSTPGEKRSDALVPRSPPLLNLPVASIDFEIA